MNDIGRYKRLRVRIWRHPGFKGLTKTARELTLYVLTGPQTNRIGLFHFSISTAAEDLETGADTLRKGLSDVCQTFGWLYDADARVLYIPSWWRWNTPENSNVLAGNLKDLNEIPSCALVDAFAANLRTLPETLHQTFLERCRRHIPDGPPIQDQEAVAVTGSKNRTQERRASRVAVNDEQPLEPITEAAVKLVAIAKEAIRHTGPNADLNLIDDHFHAIARNRGFAKVSKADQNNAIAVAMAEARRAS